MNTKSQISKKFVEIRDKGCENNSDITFPSVLLSHLMNSRPKFPFFVSFEVNRFSGAMRGHSLHRVIDTGPYIGHVGREADEELDISPERKKQRNGSVRGRSRGIPREEEAEDGEKSLCEHGLLCACLWLSYGVGECTTLRPIRIQNKRRADRPLKRSRRPYLTGGV
jgi:hypothetical protein